MRYLVTYSEFSFSGGTGVLRHHSWRVDDQAALYSRVGALAATCAPEDLVDWLDVAVNTRPDDGPDEDPVGIEDPVDIEEVLIEWIETAGETRRADGLEPIDVAELLIEMGLFERNDLWPRPPAAALDVPPTAG